jgi:UDP-N-acetylmuramate--alanine ligase
METDHLDIYRDLDDIRDTFARFVRPARAIVLCADDPGAHTLPLPASAEVVRYGIASPDARLVARDVKASGQSTSFSIFYDGDALGEITLRVPGSHNVQNALAAIATGLVLGVTLDAMRDGLSAFGGVERRFQHLYDVSGITIIDDYAHHPTEIAATLQAARGAYPGRRVVAAFQPHLFTRTRDFCNEFAAALGGADSVLLADIYPAREQPIPGITSELIARPLRETGRPVRWQGPRSELATALAELVTVGDVVITIGAGDITRTGPELKERLLSRKT